MYNAKLQFLLCFTLRDLNFLTFKKKIISLFIHESFSHNYVFGYTYHICIMKHNGKIIRILPFKLFSFEDNEIFMLYLKLRFYLGRFVTRLPNDICYIYICADTNKNSVNFIQIYNYFLKLFYLFIIFTFVYINFNYVFDFFYILGNSCDLVLEHDYNVSYKKPQADFFSLFVDLFNKSSSKYFPSYFVPVKYLKEDLNSISYSNTYNSIL